MYRKKFDVVPYYPLPHKNKTKQKKNTFRIKVVSIWCISFQNFFFFLCIHQLLVCLQLAIFNLITNFGLISMSNLAF